MTGWDDPRLPTLSGLRRRGVPARALRNFVIGLGVTKFDSLTDVAVYEHAIREDLNATALRRLAVLRPLKLTLTNLGRRRNCVHGRASQLPAGRERGHPQSCADAGNLHRKR